MTEGIVQDQLYPFERLNLYGSKGVFYLPQLASSIMQQLDPIDWNAFIDKYDLKYDGQDVFVTYLTSK